LVPPWKLQGGTATSDSCEVRYPSTLRPSLNALCSTAIRGTGGAQGGAELIFANRADAGRRLALRLQKYADRDDVIVLGIPRGGVPVAFQIAETLHAPLDVFLLRKLGVPGHEELAFGAIASGGVRIIDQQIIRALSISEFEIEAVTAREQNELNREEQVYHGGRAPLPVTGQTVILVDDGVATGASLLAGIQALRQRKPAKIVVAVPVASQAAADRVAREVDEFVCIATPEPFYAVGQFYQDFSQVSDEEVVTMPERSHESVSSRAT
jgi:putative phosphoribosyl transferase